MLNKKVVVATTTFYMPDNRRAGLALDFVKKVVEAGFLCVVVDGSPGDFGLAYRKLLTEADAIVEEENDRGMSPVRRQAMRRAAQACEGEGVVIWCEPEKHTLVSQLPLIAEPILNNKADIVIPFRNSLDTYPAFQRREEELGNDLFNRLIPDNLNQQPLDPWVGPRAIRTGETLNLFLNYGPDDGRGDLWDSIFVPIFRAIADNLRVTSVVVDYKHPSEQLIAEQCDLAMDLKRIQQFANLSSALVTEALALEWITSDVLPRLGIHFDIPI